MTPTFDRARYLDRLEKVGMTGHFGGPDITRQMLKALHLLPGQRVLDLGCGTGYTACRLVKQSGAQVVALDIRPRLLALAARRVQKEGVGASVTLAAGDAHTLPFPSDTFDVVLTESVLIFCEPARVAAEMYRVLKPGGQVAVNEFTTRGTVPAVGSKMEIPMLDAAGWHALLRGAGFRALTARVAPISLAETTLTPIRTDGLRKYLATIKQSLLDPELRDFSAEKGSREAMRLMAKMGFGLYTGRKGEEG